MEIKRRIRSRICKALCYLEYIYVNGKILFFYSANGSMMFCNIQSVPYQIGSSLRFKDKNMHIILENPIIFCKKYFKMALHDFLKCNSFYLNFPISGENRNLEPITIRFDVGHPVEPIV